MTYSDNQDFIELVRSGDIAAVKAAVASGLDHVHAWRSSLSCSSQSTGIFSRRREEVAAK